MITIGIDPGLKGAIALAVDVELIDVVDMPTADGVDPYGVASILARWGRIDRVVIEAQHAMPKQGVASTFKTGVGYGVLLGVCAALERRVVTVTASKWTRALGVGADKAAHRRRAMDTWPAMADKFSRVKDDGRADAALIALLGGHLDRKGRNMNVNLSISLTVNTDQLDTEMREWLEADCVNDGFPVSDENVAWMAAQTIANEAGMFGYAVTAEVQGVTWTVWLEWVAFLGLIAAVWAGWLRLTTRRTVTRRAVVQAHIRTVRTPRDWEQEGWA